MDDKQTFLDLAKVLKAVVTQQIAQINATASWAKTLENYLPGVSERYAQQQATVYSESQATRLLYQQIEKIIDSLTKQIDQAKGRA